MIKHAANAKAGRHGSYRTLRYREDVMLEINKLYNMDCMDGMKEFPDKFFDLGIIDPPYGIGESGDKNGSRGKLAVAKDYKAFHGGDKEPPKPEYFKELIRVTKHQVIFGANHFIERIPNANSPCWIVWNKLNGKTDFADHEMAWTNFSTAATMFTFRWQGMLQGDMKNKEDRIHPTQKPIALYTWILNNYAKKGYKILDTHVGSASSLVACHKLGYEYVGMEIDEHYYKAGSDRLNEAKAQGNIFEIIEKQQTEQTGMFEND
jgi:site-specific DNA-methyltransferase (adenine-specific)